MTRQLRTNNDPAPLELEWVFDGTFHNLMSPHYKGKGRSGALARVGPMFGGQSDIQGREVWVYHPKDGHIYFTFDMHFRGGDPLGDDDNRADVEGMVADACAQPWN